MFLYVHVYLIYINTIYNALYNNIILLASVQIYWFFLLQGLICSKFYIINFYFGCLVFFTSKISTCFSFTVCISLLLSCIYLPISISLYIIWNICNNCYKLLTKSLSNNCFTWVAFWSTFTDSFFSWLW